MSRRLRRSVLFLVGDRRVSELPAQALAKALSEAGHEIVYLGRESDARRIAACTVTTGADAVRACLPGPGGLLMLRELVRALDDRGCGQVGIVVHRVL